MTNKRDEGRNQSRNRLNDTLADHTKTVSGDSVDKLRNLEEANTLISGDEIQQQNENL
ncbi:hypothetical protein [Neobacillus drentensis]|uniref:hypothetical protein n=1 Tax=Neobacillus drentensis TaxID=220684 RepID=UPI0030007A95